MRYSRAACRVSRISMPPGLPPMSAAALFRYRLRHGEAHGAPRAGQARSNRRARCASDPPDRHSGVRRRARRDVDRDPGSAVWVSARAAYESAMARLDAVVDTLELPLDHMAALAVDPLVKVGEARSNTTEAEYKAMVTRAKDYIAAGDAFQIVIEARTLDKAARHGGVRPLSSAEAGQSVALSFCFLDFGGFQIVCSSPEILVRVHDGKVVIRPIAGTRRVVKALRKMRRWRMNCSPIRRSSPNITRPARSRPQRCRPRRRDRHRECDLQRYTVRYNHVMHIVSNVEGDFARRRRCGRGARRRLPRRHRLRRAESARDADHRRTRARTSAASTPAASAISARAAKWTPASCCAPRW